MVLAARQDTPPRPTPLAPSPSHPQASVVQPLNGDPFVGMLETPVTSAPIVAKYLSSLPAYRTGVAPVLRGVEIGLAHGFLLAGPFIKVRRGCASASARDKSEDSDLGGEMGAGPGPRASGRAARAAGAGSPGGRGRQ